MGWLWRNPGTQQARRVNSGQRHLRVEVEVGGKTDLAFLGDIKPLLRADVDYDAATAMAQVKQAIVGRLPGAPWRGSA